MNTRWSEMILSQEPRQRNKRHLIAWLLWWVYIIFTVFVTWEKIPVAGSPPGGSFSQRQPGLDELGYLSYFLLVGIKSFLLLLTHLAFCYTTLYIVLTGFRLRKNYLRQFLLVFAYCILMVPVVYFLYSLVFPLIDNLFSLDATLPDTLILWASISAGLIYAIKLTLIAIAIKLLKSWWLKQKEKEQLEKGKINAELQLLKAQIHPAFLFSTLNNIISHARVASPQAPEMLIKLSDLLSYMLYECEAPKVKLEREISMIKEYLVLEKIRQGDRLELTFQVKGEQDGKLICPLLLFPFVDNSLSYCANQGLEQAWINLEITIDGHDLIMKLINGLPSAQDGETSVGEKNLLNVQKRLSLLYPGRHELKINAEQELLMTHLNLTLEEALPQNHSQTQSNNIALSHAAI
jgi:sensor histidine kinase YesM